MLLYGPELYEWSENVDVLFAILLPNIDNLYEAIVIPRDLLSYSRPNHILIDAGRNSAWYMPFWENGFCYYIRSHYSFLT